MKMAPKLEEGETVQASTEAKLGDVIRNNVVITVTDDHLFVRPKKGRKVANEEKDKSNIDIALDTVQAIRRTGGLTTKIVEVETQDDVYELPEFHTDSKEIINAVVKTEGLKESSWGKEKKGKRAARGILGSVLAAIGFGSSIVSILIGLLFVLTGIAMSLTIVGAIIGIPVALLGIWIMTGGGMMGSLGSKSGGWGFRKEEEWIRPDQKQLSD